MAADSIRCLLPTEIACGKVPNRPRHQWPPCAVLEGYKGVDVGAALAHFFNERRACLDYDVAESESIVRAAIYEACIHLSSVASVIPIHNENIFLALLGCLCVALKNLDDRRVFNRETAAFIPGMDVATLNHIELVVFSAMVRSGKPMVILAPS